jgi:predicted HTH domain antitoxin
MKSLSGDQQENMLTAASLNAAVIEELEEQLKSRRSLQKSFGIQLVLKTDIPLAEVSRVIGVHRMTLHRWVKEENARISGKSDS